MHENVITRPGCWGNQMAAWSKRVVILCEGEGLIRDCSSKFDGVWW